MRRIMMAFTLSALLVGQAVWAQDQTSGDDNASTTTTTEKEVTHGYLKDEVVSFKPMVGVLAFTDATGSTTSRGAAGLGIDWNLASSAAPRATNLYIGPSTGVFYSHLGSAGSNFFGTSPSTSSSPANASLLLIPADLKIGYAFTDNFRLSVHGGGNVIYRTAGSSIDFGPSSATDSSVWRIYPNAGGDIEVGLGASSVALDIRPDVTVTPGNTLFAGMVGLSFLLS